MLYKDAKERGVHPLLPFVGTRVRVEDVEESLLLRSVGKDAFTVNLMTTSNVQIRWNPSLVSPTDFLPERPTLWLLDIMTDVRRAYHSSQPDSEDNRFIQILDRILLTFIRDHDPAYCVAALESHVTQGEDVRRGLERCELDPDYKANRKPMPEDLRAMIPEALKLLDAYGIRQISCPKHEGDDVIGTLSRQAEEQGFWVRIRTLDQDLYQLVNENVSVFDTHSKRNMMIGSKEVKKLKGVSPVTIPQLKALMGDPTDNIKGIPGVGEVKALKAIKEGTRIGKGSLAWLQSEGVGIDLDRVTKDLKLATVRTDLPIIFDAPWYVVIHRPKLRQIIMGRK